MFLKQGNKNEVGRKKIFKLRDIFEEYLYEKNSEVLVGSVFLD